MGPSFSLILNSENPLKSVGEGKHKNLPRSKQPQQPQYGLKYNPLNPIQGLQGRASWKV